MGWYARASGSLLLFCACSRAAPESNATRSAPLATIASASDAAAATEAGGAVDPFIVRIHRFGGGPASLDHTLEVLADGSARLRGYDDLWCTRVGNHPFVRAVVDTRVTLDRAIVDELRVLATHPAITRFVSAAPPARAPSYDGVAAEISLPSHPLILVDGVHEVGGKMGRLLDLDRELAARHGSAAACH